MVIKNIIFDFGGVIIQLDPTEAVSRFQSLGIKDAPQQMNIFGQRGIFLEIENGSITAEQFCKKLALEAKRQSNLFPDDPNPSYSFDKAQWAWLGYVAGIKDIILKELLSLKQQYNVCLLSNTNPFMMKWAESNDFSGDGHPIQYYFHHLFYSYKMHDYKPSESIFKKMLKEGGMKAEECLFLDDSPHNIQAAESIGIHGLLVAKDENWIDRLRNELQKLESE